MVLFTLIVSCLDLPNIAWPVLMYELDQLLNEHLTQYTKDQYDLEFVGGTSYNAPVNPQFCLVVRLQKPIADDLVHLLKSTKLLDFSKSKVFIHISNLE